MLENQNTTEKTLGEQIIDLNLRARLLIRISPEYLAIINDFSHFVDSTRMSPLEMSAFLSERLTELHFLIKNNPELIK